MRMARCLRDLLLIRDANAGYIDSVNGTLGSALGYKNKDGDPAILIFVPRKIKAKWLPNASEIQTWLEDKKRGIRCRTDIVESTSNVAEDDIQVRVKNPDGDDVYMPCWDLLNDRPLNSDAKRELLERLRGWAEKITPGSQVCGVEAGSPYYGTLGCFARDNRTGRLGFITNRHVAGKPGTPLWFPERTGIPLGVCRKAIERVHGHDRFPGIVKQADTQYWVDCAFVQLHPGAEQIDPRLPVLFPKGDKMVPLGLPLACDLESMKPVGQKVVAVGRTRSCQRGTIAAFAYQWDEVQRRGGKERHFTDLLIVGEKDDVFCGHGDSGKLIVTDDSGHHPVGLVWGTWREKLQTGGLQQDWAYGISIDEVLKLLDVAIVGNAAALRACRGAD